MRIRTDLTSCEGTVFSEDILEIEICGPGEDYLTTIDVPGIFRDPSECYTGLGYTSLCSVRTKAR